MKQILYFEFKIQDMSGFEWAGVATVSAEPKEEDHMICASDLQITDLRLNHKSMQIKAESLAFMPDRFSEASLGILERKLGSMWALKMNEDRFRPNYYEPTLSEQERGMKSEDVLNEMDRGL